MKVNNLNKVIVNLKGETVAVLSPTPEQIKKATVGPVTEEGQAVNMQLLPRYTIKELFLDALAAKVPTDKKEGFILYAIATELHRAGDSVTFSDEDTKFLVQVVEEGIIRIEKDHEGKDLKLGIFYFWAAMQALKELGITVVKQEPTKAKAKK